MRDPVGIAFTALFVAVSLAVILRPIVVLRWVTRMHPEVAEDGSHLKFVRFIGVGNLIVGLLILWGFLH